MPRPCKPVRALRISLIDRSGAHALHILLGDPTFSNSTVLDGWSVRGDRALDPRSNLGFGDDDPLQWPQPFTGEYPRGPSVEDIVVVACSRFLTQQKSLHVCLFFFPNDVYIDK